MHRPSRASIVDEVEAQLNGILGEPPTPEIIERVFSRSDGNAFFTEELVAAGGERAQSSELPSSLREVLLVRVEECSDATQELLRIAAAAGRTVHHSLLARVARRDDAVLSEQLREAVAEQLIEIAGEREYAFRHALLQEALYDELLPGERVDVHAAYVRALSEQPELAGETRPSVSALLAHQCGTRARCRSAASVEPRCRPNASRRFRRRAEHYERALSLWSSAPGDRADLPLDHLDVLHGLADAEYLMANFDRALPSHGHRDCRGPRAR